MSMAKKIAFNNFLKKHGIKLAWMAGEMDMGEELLRYHMNRGFMGNPDLGAKFRNIIREHAIHLIRDLEQLPLTNLDQREPSTKPAQNCAA